MPTNTHKKTAAIVELLQRELLQKEHSLASARKTFDAIYLNFHSTPDIKTVDDTCLGVPVTYFYPQNPHPDYLIIFMHGGGFTLGSTNGHKDFITRIANGTQIATLSIDYGLAPEQVFPAAINDCMTVYQSCLSQYKPNHIFMLGMTAGGTLVLSSLLKIKQSALPLPRAAICLSPPTDLTFTHASINTNQGKDWVSKQRLLTIEQTYLATCPATNPIASPQYAALDQLPPLLIQVGTHELLLDDSVVFAEKARQCGVETTLQTWDQMIHGWHMFASELIEGQQAIDAIATYIKEKM